MAIGTPVNLKQNSFGSSTVTTMNFTAVTSNAGEALIIILCLGSAATAGTVAASDGSNTYSATNLYVGSSGKVILLYCANPVALSSGTVTVSWTGAATVVGALIQVAGLDLTSPIDKNPATGSGGTAVTTITEVTTGTLAQADELVIGATCVSAAPGAWTEDVDFTSLTTSIGSGGNREIHWGYRITAATTSVGYQPSWVTARNYTANIWSFKGAAAEVATRQILTLGVG